MHTPSSATCSSASPRSGTCCRDAREDNPRVADRRHAAQSDVANGRYAARVFEEPLNAHRRLRYSVRGPEWAFVIPHGDWDALADAMRRCSSFWNGAGSLILPVKANGALPRTLNALLDAREIDLAWVHPSIDEALYPRLTEKLRQLARLHERFDQHETHPLRLRSADEDKPRGRLVVPSTDSAVKRMLTLALWGDISKEDLPHYQRRYEVSWPSPGKASWKSLIDGQIAGPVTSPLLMVQEGMNLVWASSSAEYPYLWVFSARPSFTSMVEFWNFRARLLADSAGAPVLGVPHQALSSPGALASLGEWLHRPPGHRSTPDCFVVCDAKQEQSVTSALATVPVVPELSGKYSNQVGNGIIPNNPPTFAFRGGELWARFQRGLVNTQLITIVNGRTSLVLPAPDAFQVRDFSHVRVTMHDLPVPMPVTRSIAESIYVNALPGDGGVRITTSATAEWNLDISLPTAVQALNHWAGDLGFDVVSTREALDAEAILKRLSSLERLDVLASAKRLALLERLAPLSTRKLAQRLVAELRAAGETVAEEAIAERLGSMASFLELRGRTAADLASGIGGGGATKKEVLTLLPDLVAAGFVRRARDVVCPDCRYRTLLGLSEQAEIVRCQACEAQFALPVVDPGTTKEPDMIYRLDGLMARALSQDILPVLLTLRAFAKSRPALGSFAAWPGLVFAPRDGSRAVEVDLLVSFGASVFCCEVKKTARTLKEVQLLDLLGICERLDARPAIAALNGTFSGKLAAVVNRRGGRVLDGGALLAGSPGVDPPDGRLGRFAGLAGLSGASA